MPSLATGKGRLAGVRLTAGLSQTVGLTLGLTRGLTAGLAEVRQHRPMFQWSIMLLVLVLPTISCLRVV